MKFIRYFIYYLLVFVLTSCYTSPEPIENHKGVVIYEKKGNPPRMRFEVKYKKNDSIYDFKTVYV